MSLSPIRIVKNPEGSLQRAAEQQGELARERREIKVCTFYCTFRLLSVFFSHLVFPVFQSLICVFLTDWRSKEQQRNSLMENIPRDISKAWEDPLAVGTERHLAQELRSIGLPGAQEVLFRLVYSYFCSPTVGLNRSL